MFEWPRFAAHLNGGRSAEQGVVSLLVDLAKPTSAPSVKDVLLALFEDDALVDAVGHLSPRLHHVGFVAPAHLTPGAAEEMLRASPFHGQLRAFKSAILAKEISSRLGRHVEVMIVQGSVAGHPGRNPAVEIFLADLPAEEIETLVAQEIGCHVALALDSTDALNRVRQVLHAHGRWEIPLMRHGPLVNDEMHSSVVYVDVPGREQTRRLEFITFNATG